MPPNESRSVLLAKAMFFGPRLYPHMMMTPSPCRPRQPVCGDAQGTPHLFSKANRLRLALAFMLVASAGAGVLLILDVAAEGDDELLSS